MRTVLQAIDKGFAFIRTAQSATEVKNCVVICQWEIAEIFFQVFESVADFRRVGFVGFCVGLVQLIQDGFAIIVTGIKGVGFYVSFQPLNNLIHVGTSLPFVI